MLGRYTAQQLGQITLPGILQTTEKTQETIEEIIPTVKKIATHYERISPQIDFATKYWSTTLVLLFGVMIVGSAIGDIFVDKFLKK